MSPKLFVGCSLLLALWSASLGAQAHQATTRVVTVVLADQIGAGDARAAVRREAGSSRVLILLKHDASADEFGAASMLAAKLASLPAPDKHSLTVVRNISLTWLPPEVLARLRRSWSADLMKTRSSQAVSVPGYGIARSRTLVLTPARRR